MGEIAMQAIQRLCKKNARICTYILATKARGKYKPNSKTLH